MEEATQAAIVVVATEIIVRLLSCDVMETMKSLTMTTYVPSLYYSVVYGLCILPVLFNVKKYAIMKSAELKYVLNLIHSVDGLLSLTLGLAHYLQSNWLLALSIIAITKGFLIHLLSRMVTGQATFTSFQVCVQTTKTYLHHVGSFIFLSPNYPSTIVITALWRCVSMTGHAALAFRDKLSPTIFDSVLWKVTHGRNISILLIWLFCWNDPKIRRGFAVSSVGHISYLIVRMGPVFRLGSIYVKEGEEKTKWQSLSDWNRLQAIVKFQYPYFTIELGLMFLMVIFLFYLRLTSTLLVEANCLFY